MVVEVDGQVALASPSREASRGGPGDSARASLGAVPAGTQAARELSRARVTDGHRPAHARLAGASAPVLTDAVAALVPGPRLLTPGRDAEGVIRRGVTRLPVVAAAGHLPLTQAEGGRARTLRLHLATVRGARGRATAGTGHGARGRALTLAPRVSRERHLGRRMAPTGAGPGQQQAHEQKPPPGGAAGHGADAGGGFHGSSAAHGSRGAPGTNGRGVRPGVPAWKVRASDEAPRAGGASPGGAQQPRLPWQ